ncbi:MAG: 2-oxoglutarate dehydrogenase E1 component [Geminicoccaceae bacterium]|nr:2-oxoglutarate dehydrogenase E1 component [Geminicoccaceae bacterium]
MATRRELEQTAFLYGGNGAFIEDLYARYLDDPSAVDQSWRGYFDELGPETANLFRRSRAALEVGPASSAPQAEPAPETARGGDVIDLGGERTKRMVLEHLRVVMLIRAYRVRGHLLADLDPLGLAGDKHHPELDPKAYGFDENDLDREFFLDQVLGLEKATLRQIVAILRQTYSDKIGIEFMHIQEPDQKAWIQQRIEYSHNLLSPNIDGKREILEQMTQAEGFEKFLHVKFPGTKRFGLDGGESTIPALEAIMRKSAELGVEEIIIGMPHRGRLNVLANVMGKPYAAIFSEFQGSAVQDEVLGSGDVKYHLGTSTDRVLPDGQRMHLSLTANPSHLEAVNPVVLGKVRAKQTQQGDTERSKVMGILLHGDAAFAGQGVVHEGFEMSELKGFRTGGTVHIIVNNQIGFTTSPMYGRSSPYPSDVARGNQAPIFHVNGDDPEAVVQVALLAAEFRQTFKKDVVIDLWCYRRHGHNEGDEPSFTQPLMYRRIAEHPTIREIYARRLIEEGALTEDESQRMHDEFQEQMAQAHEAAAGYKSNKADWLEGVWSGLRMAPEEYERGKTGAPVELLQEIGRTITEIPDGFNVHRRLQRVIGQRRKAIEEGKGIDWATAEHLAFGTLLREGFPVRLCGQDSGRGTFSQRHAVIYDQETEERLVPLTRLHEDQATFEVVDSFLSEEGVLGFEYGYSLAEPNALVLWEAQFGDFCNGAQVYFDQFISSGEAKWLRMSGLVCLLPHGYEGQGPEHSSARLERFLQLYAEDNIQVLYPSTPANFFHALRRQLHRDFRKPLIVMTPKSLLRNRRCTSTLEEMASGTSFHRVMYEQPPSQADRDVERIVLCTGKVYYDLQARREELGLDDRVALIRIEQLAPFPERVLAEELVRYPKRVEIVWCQEEPRNMGAWFFVAPQIELLLEEVGMRQSRLIYAGRAPAASPASGLHHLHVKKQAALVDMALTGETEGMAAPA